MKYALFVLLTIVFFSCRKKSDDPKQLGKDYCDCMEKNNSPKEYLYARAICDGELIQKYPYYKYARVELRYHIFPNGRLSYEEEGRVGVFMNSFEHYIIDHCCNVSLTCPPDSTNQKK